jgi:hypothetical protein
MSWTEDAQKSQSGTSDKKAGDPVQGCAERASMEAMLDYDEPVELQAGVYVSVPPELESKIATEPAPASLESSVYVEPPEEED